MVEFACIDEGQESDSSSEEGAEDEAARQSLEAERELAQVLAKQGEKDPGETPTCPRQPVDYATSRLRLGCRTRPRDTDPPTPSSTQRSLAERPSRRRALEPKGWVPWKEVLALDRIVDGGDSPRLRLQHSTNMFLS